VCTAQAKAPELLPPRHDVLIGVLLVEERLEVLNRTFVVRQLICTVLTVLGELECSVLGNCTFAGVQNASDEVEKRGLSSTVGTKDSYTGIHTRS
jgi:hypothetical protein